MRLSSFSVFFVHILKVTHQIFLIFLMKPWLLQCEKCQFLFFGEEFKIGPFLGFGLILSGKFFIWYFFIKYIYLSTITTFSFVKIPHHVTKFWFVLCKNDQNSLKIDLSCTFLPNFD